jgi:apolipoprotein N-acyltransferase
MGVAVSALLLASSFPLPDFLKGLESASAVWLGLIPLIIVIRTSRPRAAFWWSWLSGFMFWLVSLIWLLQLRNSWGNLPLVALGWVALAAYCALYTGIFGLLLSVIYPVPAQDCAGRSTMWRRLAPVLAAPLIWVGCEYLRSWIGTGFPWNALGVSQYRNIASIQVAALGGVYAVSALIVLLNAALAMTALRVSREIFMRAERQRVHYEMMLGLLLVALCWSFGVQRVKSGDAACRRLDGIRMAVVQPDIPQPQKWDEAFGAAAHKALREGSELAQSGGSDLLLWPETALPEVLRMDESAQKLVRDVVRSAKTPLLLGAMDAVASPNGRVDYYNCGFIVSSNGCLLGEYRKRHLVPFGEYIPFENQVAFIKRMAPLGFSCMPGEKRQVLMKIRNSAGDEVSLGVLICFEDTFGYLARDDVRRGARVLINLTNDAWFDPSAASRQHMANAVLRAVENRVPLVRCANTGVSCFVDRFGRIADTDIIAGNSDGHGISGFLVSELRFEGADMPLTPYTRFGDWLFAIPCAVMVVVMLLRLLWMARYNKKRAAA